MQPAIFHLPFDKAHRSSTCERRCEITHGVIILTSGLALILLNRKLLEGRDISQNQQASFHRTSPRMLQPYASHIQ